MSTIFTIPIVIFYHKVYIPIYMRKFHTDWISENRNRTVKSRFVLLPPPKVLEVIQHEALKVEQFEITLHDIEGLATRENKTRATVDVEYSARYENRDVKLVRKFTGPANEVYGVFMGMFIANKDLFIKAWNRCKDGAYKSITGIPYRQAPTYERLANVISDSGIHPEKLAQILGKDYSNFHKELRGKAPLTVKQAMEYSKVLRCDPVDLLFDEQLCSVWGHVDIYQGFEAGETYFAGQIIPQAEPDKVIVPRDIYRPNIRAVKIFSEGSYLDRQLAFYYKSDVNEQSHNGKLVVGATHDEDLEKIGYEPYRYWFGIYEVQRGGKQSIVNVDPFAEVKNICSGPFEWIAPVVATIQPRATKKDFNYFESNDDAKQIFKYEQLLENYRRQQKLLIELNDRVKSLRDKVEREKLLDTLQVVRRNYDRTKDDLDEIPTIIKRKVG